MDMNDRILSGTATGCFISEFSSPNILRVLKVAGIAFFIVDAEHGAFDLSQVSALCGMANGLGLPIFVRVPGLERDFTQKSLDAGADGIVFPMVSTPEEARLAVRLTKYPPLGARGASAMRPHSEYAPGKLVDYMARANERVKTFVQIETAAGVSNAASIAAIPGLDALLIGPNDLSIDLGHPGDSDAPALREAVRKVIRSAADAGKPSGIITSNVDFIRWCRKEGMTILSCNSEVGLLLNGARAMLNAAANPAEHHGS
jgi:2-dehydro-3-deoxyglucarate aldolase/4-hydroxy-2-oxoheptanedioate aldolase